MSRGTASITTRIPFQHRTLGIQLLLAGQGAFNGVPGPGGIRNAINTTVSSRARMAKSESIIMISLDFVQSVGMCGKVQFNILEEPGWGSLGGRAPKGTESDRPG